MRNETEKDHNSNENERCKTPTEKKENLYFIREDNESILTDNLSKITESDHDIQQQVSQMPEALVENNNMNNFISVRRISNNSHINFDASKSRRHPIKITRVSECSLMDRSESNSPNHSKIILFSNFIIFLII